MTFKLSAACLNWNDNGAKEQTDESETIAKPNTMLKTGCALARRPSRTLQINALQQSRVDCISALALVCNGLEIDRPLKAKSRQLERRLRSWTKSSSMIRCRGTTMWNEAIRVDTGGEA